MTKAPLVGGRLTVCTSGSPDIHTLIMDQDQNYDDGSSWMGGKRIIIMTLTMMGGGSDDGFT